VDNQDEMHSLETLAELAETELKIRGLTKLKQKLVKDVIDFVRIQGSIHSNGCIFSTRVNYKYDYPDYIHDREMQLKALKTDAKGVMAPVETSISLVIQCAKNDSDTEN